VVFVCHDTAPPEIYTLSLHDALPISSARPSAGVVSATSGGRGGEGNARIRNPAMPTNTPVATTAPFRRSRLVCVMRSPTSRSVRSEEHTSELQSRFDLVCRLLLEKKK